jgi:hypothetical protein
MRFYRVLWGASAVIAAACAAVSVISAGTWPGVLGVSLMLASCGGLLAHTFCEGRPDRWRWTARATVWTFAAAAVSGGLALAWPRAGGIAAVVLVAACPFLVGRYRALLLGWTVRRSDGPLDALATRDLLRRWEWTTSQVVRSSAPLERRMALVEQRRRLLDELERRDPDHFDEWVVSAVPDRGQPGRPRRRA